ncbi:MAG: FAD-dependent thymidylate synthase [Alphaproteobacteria bacterium TMED93]|jgi:thymidylate synthase (FAD)|nr:thymidylate synthase (FAD) [Candidatus Pelagibacter sp.]RPH06247.1 MAG: FAD-dependent thymidylate synthase [Alphaproteobacteria bacterium TMED93]|tara:strand:- start:768 stop:1379 length:612 start_codon:yes stop_codon:yes gene_type:complete
MNVQLIDKMGSDLSVVNAARVSFAKRKELLDEKDEKLIKYLAEHDHWSPFGHTSLQFLIKAPIFVARQLVKHQVGLVWNEVSRRYVDDKPEFYIPFMWRKRAENKKQGSSNEEVEYDITDFVSKSKELYNDMLESEIAPEMARMILPQNMMTEWYWSGSLMAFARVVNLRIKEDTQEETRVIATHIDKHLKDHFPISAKHLLK